MLDSIVHKIKMHQVILEKDDSFEPGYLMVFTLYIITASMFKNLLMVLLIMPNSFFEFLKITSHVQD